MPKNKQDSDTKFKALPFLLTTFTILWSLFWLGTAGYGINFLYLFVVIPALIGSLLLSPFLITFKSLRFIPVAGFSGILSLLLLFLAAWGSSHLLSSTSTYYLGIDISTPNGVVSKKSMVQATSFQLPVALKQFNFRFPPAKGEAVFCELGNGKTVIASLWFDKLRERQSLKELPWLAAGFSKEDKSNWPESLGGRLELKGELAPLTVVFPDITFPQARTRIFIDEASDALGPGYAINSIWIEMTEDPYRSFGIRDHVPWIKSKREAGIMDLSQKKHLTRLGISRAYNPLVLTEN